MKQEVLLDKELLLLIYAEDLEKKENWTHTGRVEERESDRERAGDPLAQWV